MLGFVRKFFRRPPAGPPKAEIRVGSFPRKEKWLYALSPAQVSGARTGSLLCRHETLDSPAFRSWVQALGEVWQAHRKLWELAYICQVLQERGMLAPGKKGLGFAVGQEKLPAFFASRGCRITASDLPADDERNRPWAETGQWAGSLEALNRPGLCPDDIFRTNVVFRPVDMNAIPDDLTGFDFTWSTCSFEHCGSLELGLAFMKRQMDCLRPGGVAVHTTEFNLTSNEDTLEAHNLAIYRLRDIESLCAWLREKGHRVEPLDLSCGRHETDTYVDRPEYYPLTTETPHLTRHLRLDLAGYAATSIGLVVVKKDGAAGGANAEAGGPRK